MAAWLLEPNDRRKWIVLEAPMTEDTRRPTEIKADKLYQAYGRLASKRLDLEREIARTLAYDKPGLEKARKANEQRDAYILLDAELEEAWAEYMDALTSDVAAQRLAERIAEGKHEATEAAIDAADKAEDPFTTASRVYSTEEPS